MKSYSRVRVVYYTFISSVMFFIPVIVMSIVYALIVCKLWARRAPGDSMQFDVSLQIAAKKKVSSHSLFKVTESTAFLERKIVNGWQAD